MKLELTKNTKKPRGPLQVGLDEWEVEEMRAIAECMGCSLSSFVRQSLRAFWHSAENRLGIASFTATAIARHRRMEMGRQRRHLEHVVDCKDQRMN
jgi:hypothetical protein